MKRFSSKPEQCRAISDPVWVCARTEVGVESNFQDSLAMIAGV